ncbi:MAG: exosortase/archaeosortase family protein [Nibricoccus sp.]
MTSPQATQPGRQHQAEALRKCIVPLTVLVLVFSLPLYSLVRFSVQSSLYSHIVLIPFVSAYLIWVQRASLPAVAAPWRLPAYVCFGMGVASTGGYWFGKFSGANLAPVDNLALTTLSLVSFVAGLCAWLLGRQMLRAIAFPVAFLLFMVPLPTAVETMTETFLQHGSALAARFFFMLAGTTVYANGLSFQLPGITLQIAPECSGIHSSLALLITSLVTGQLVLRSRSKRIILALAVIPLALLRNGLRVFVIGELCVHIGPEMIDSYIHRQGGPIFFVISLVPFFLLLALLIRLERKSKNKSLPTKS